MPEMATPTPQQVLDLAMPENDSGASTIRGYLVTLLATLWREGEGFSGKRPFGNSSWQCDLYIPMIQAGMIEGTVDEDGYLDDLPLSSERKADGLILAAINALGDSDG